ncbi:hypothetical protein BDN72DRAFT_844518 [Pluteus cervinus]|uniref:Uncharacterized protein n=1 Tax=Pluteus cervinus TaxID=181527 RepID=A0ACD3AK68_9AGAR|nr:hypothetical protein BDN72DRAFT_844518 [Pluteus cervinus]
MSFYDALTLSSTLLKGPCWVAVAAVQMSPLLSVGKLIIFRSKSRKPSYAPDDNKDGPPRLGSQVLTRVPRRCNKVRKLARSMPPVLNFSI